MPSKEDSTSDKKSGWKQRFKRELIEYWVNFVYLAFYFGVFAWYRRLVLAEYQIGYLHYGISIIEALILAKVILIGNALHLGRGLEGKPLAFVTLYKAVIFSMFVGVFAVLEHTIGGLIDGKGLAYGVLELWHTGMDELLARCMVTFFAFIPFFAFQELEQVLGEGWIRKVFFHSRTATGPGFHGPATAG
jgi:hypothetical protein